MIDPQPPAIIAPAVVFATGRPAALPCHRGFALNVALAVMPSSIVRGAGELHGLVSASPVVTVPIAITVMVPVSIMLAVRLRGASIHHEVCATSPVDPDSVLVKPPGGALGTGRAAALALHGHTSPRVSGTVMAPPIFGRAGYDILCEGACSSGHNKESQGEGKESARHIGSIMCGFMPADKYSRMFPVDGSRHSGLVETQHAASLLLADRKSTRLNSSHLVISYAVFCLKKKK